MRGDPLLGRIAADMRERRVLSAGEPVLAMVSGGPDSLVLLHALVALHDGPVSVLSVDHGLRAQAAEECAAVLRIADGLGVDATVVRLRLEPGAGVQRRARDARYAAARQVAAVSGAAIAVGHTLDDQAETVLMRLARGTGRDGAAGMRWRSGDLARPLLGVRAHETREWCVAHGLTAVDDPTNRDARGTRVRARRLMADLEALHGGAAIHLAGFAQRMDDERELLEALEGEAWGRCAQGDGLSIAGLAGESAAVRRLLVRRLLHRAGCVPDAAGAAAVDRVLALIDGPARCEVDGRAVVREAGVLRVVDAVRTPRADRLSVPGSVDFGGLRLTARHGAAEAPGPARVALRVNGPLTVRSPRPGDRLALAGGGRARVGRLLADAGVPARLRGTVPVVEDADGRPVWVAGHRADATALAPAGEMAVVVEVHAR
ncbi:MAG: tRNA lysidine(34) synthetase TilS [Thermoleophilia bacterium]